MSDQLTQHYKTGGNIKYMQNGSMFTKPNQFIHCQTKAEFLNKLAKLQKEGWKWQSGDKPLKHIDYWDIHKKETCLDVDENNFKNKKFCYCSKRLYLDNGYLDNGYLDNGYTELKLKKSKPRLITLKLSTAIREIAKARGVEPKWIKIIK